MKWYHKWITAPLLVTGGHIAYFFSNRYGWLNPGNAPYYSIKGLEPVKDSPLRGKHLIFLGSSVTKGYCSFHESFVEGIAHRHQAHVVKEAVSGTTLVDTKDDSYVSRLKRLDIYQPCDLFICQLSTNDATNNMPIGQVSKSTNLEDFDTKTITGALEYIFAYVKKQWHCPIVVFTSPQFSDERYQDSVNALYQLKDKWDIQIINFWNHADLVQNFNTYPFMHDELHPTKRGYRIWTRYMEEAMIKVINGQELTEPKRRISVPKDRLYEKRLAKQRDKRTFRLLAFGISAVVLLALGLFTDNK